MPKNSISLQEKIAKLEDEKQQLINKRKDEIANLFLKHQGIAIDNKTILGFIKHYNAQAKENNLKDDQIISSFRELSPPSQRTKRIEQPAKTSYQKINLF